MIAAPSLQWIKVVRAFFRALIILLLLAAAAAGGAWWWLHQPLQLSQPNLELEIEPGTPGLFIERRGFLSDGRTAEFTQSFYRGDAYDVVAELNG